MDAINAILTSIRNDIKQVEVLSQNVANANTPGYVGQQTFASYMGPGQPSEVKSVPMSEQKKVISTQRPLDIALTEQGYFVIEKDGEQYLTRHGRFHFNPQGVVTHVSGGALMGEQGAIRVASAQMEVSVNGDIRDERSSVVDRLVIVEPGQPQSLTSVGNGLYRHQGQMNQVPANVRQGAINGAGNSSTADMIQLIEVSRHVQSLQKALHGLDQINNAGINELGKR